MRRTREWAATYGRDAGRKFKITEMPADQAERWAVRALLALANAGAKIPDDMLNAGMSGVVASFPMLMVQGVRCLAGLNYKDAEPLLDEMMGCVQFVPPGLNTTIPLARGDACQIEEVVTRLQLRYEVLQIHVDFSLAGALPNSTQSPQSPAQPAA